MWYSWKDVIFDLMLFALFIWNLRRARDPDGHGRCTYCGVNATVIREYCIPHKEKWAWIHRDWCRYVCVNDQAKNFLEE